MGKQRNNNIMCILLWLDTSVIIYYLAYFNPERYLEPQCIHLWDLKRTRSHSDSRNLHEDNNDMQDDAEPNPPNNLCV